ncbi:MAG TPA: hypothetical protein IGS37_15005 [Synechococcales cyanobacterium M55_K2018_004]|nr:hypothetical protein [Synechococcales cyanobacterium M55_K2018_004]
MPPASLLTHPMFRRPRPSRISPDPVTERPPVPPARQRSIQPLALWTIALLILGSGSLLYGLQRGWLPNFKTAPPGIGSPAPTPAFLPASPSASQGSMRAIAPLPSSVPPSMVVPSTTFKEGQLPGEAAASGTGVFSQPPPHAIALPSVPVAPTQVLAPLPNQPTLLNSTLQGNSLLTVNATAGGSTAPSHPLPHPLATALHRLAEAPAAEPLSFAPVSSSRVPTFGLAAGAAPPTQQMSPPVGSTGYIVPQEVRSPTTATQPGTPSMEDVIDPFADLEPSSAQAPIPEPPPFSVPGRTIGNGEMGTFSNPGIQPD